MMSAAAMATRLRVNCDDIFNLLFHDPVALACGPMNKDNQGVCQSRKTAKKFPIQG
jgi:hypothetical protein